RILALYLYRHARQPRGRADRDGHQRDGGRLERYRLFHSECAARLQDSRHVCRGAHACDARLYPQPPVSYDPEPPSCLPLRLHPAARLTSTDGAHRNCIFVHLLSLKSGAFRAVDTPLEAANLIVIRKSCSEMQKVDGNAGRDAAMQPQTEALNSLIASSSSK